MPIPITMPRLSDTMEVGTVIKWNVKEGDTVEPGQVLADVETDKATMELQSYDAGKVAKILVKEGQSLAVGATILVLAAEGESIEDAAKSAGAATGASSAPSAKPQVQSAAAAAPPRPASPPTASSTAVAEPPRRPAPAAAPAAPAPEPLRHAAPAHPGRVPVSPLARKMAEEIGIDVSRLTGSGPGGRIVKADIEAAAQHGGPPAHGAARAPSATAAPAPAPPAIPLEHRIVALSNIRRTIARRLVESKTTIPHYQVTLSVALDALMDLREQINDQLAPQGVKLSVNDFIVRACATAMHQHPFVNSRWLARPGEEAIEILPDVNIGVAIALPIERGGGLVVGVLRNADRMGLRAISAETKRLAAKAREKGLTVEEMDGSTFTISNLGMYGVDHFTAIINPPNAAILAVGAAVERPVVHDGEVVIGREMSMTMSSDHRIVDGATAAEYLTTVKRSLEAPASLMV